MWCVRVRDSIAAHVHFPSSTHFPVATVGILFLVQVYYLLLRLRYTGAAPGYLNCIWPRAASCSYSSSYLWLTVLKMSKHTWENIKTYMLIEYFLYLVVCLNKTCHRQKYKYTQSHTDACCSCSPVLTVSCSFVFIFRRVGTVSSCRAGAHAEDVPGRRF